MPQLDATIAEASNHPPHVRHEDTDGIEDRIDSSGIDGSSWSTTLGTDRTNPRSNRGASAAATRQPDNKRPSHHPSGGRLIDTQAGGIVAAGGFS